MHKVMVVKYYRFCHKMANNFVSCHKVVEEFKKHKMAF